MNYVVSDVHGHLELLKKGLQKINFSDDDILYIIGDMIDTGPNSIGTIQYIMSHKNIRCVKGNHEMFLIECINFRRRRLEINPNYKQYWEVHGGAKTIEALLSLKVPEVRSIYNYVRNLPFYRIVRLGDRRYILVHVCISQKSFDVCKDSLKPNEHKTVRNVLGHMDEIGFVRRRSTTVNQSLSLDSHTMIYGHVHTKMLGSKTNTFVRYENSIAIDCGGSSSRPKLGFLCLETDEETYVEYHDERGEITDGTNQ